MTRRTNRRDFLTETTLAGFGVWVAGGVALAERRSANETVNIACIGVGGKGDSDSSQAGNNGNIVAICDIDDHTLDAKAREFPQAKKYHDYRKMLDDMGKTIDAVTVSTPDHHHAPASIRAMKMGKHVYCQKPLVHTVHEARLMRQVAKEQKVCTQMGNQGTATKGLRDAVDAIRAGVIGEVREVHVWTNRPIWPQAPQVTERPPTAAVPKHVHWDLWLGAAPERPYAVYKNGRPAYHPFAWRGWWDFGTGALGDMGCHTANLPFMALKLNHPTSVEAECGGLNPETYPGWARVTYHFPARGDMPGVKAVWYEGHKDGKQVLPPADLVGGGRLPSSGSITVGDKGVLYSPSDYGAYWELRPDGKVPKHPKVEAKLPRHHGGDEDSNMKKEWVQAIKEGKPSLALSNFDYATRLTEFILLGNVAIKANGRKLEYDGRSGRITNDSEANEWLTKHYRQGWKV
jgi:predicted dehydrogenase